jgi:hypothetical protein
MKNNNFWTKNTSFGVMKRRYILAVARNKITAAIALTSEKKVGNRIFCFAQQSYLYAATRCHKNINIFPN